MRGLKDKRVLITGGASGIGADRFTVMTDGGIGIALLRKGVSLDKRIRNQAGVRVRGRRAIPDRRSWFGASRPDQGRDQENAATDFGKLHWVSCIWVVCLPNQKRTLEM